MSETTKIEEEPIIDKLPDINITSLKKIFGSYLWEQKCSTSCKILTLTTNQASRNFEGTKIQNIPGRLPENSRRWFQ